MEWELQASSVALSGHQLCRTPSPGDAIRLVWADVWALVAFRGCLGIPMYSQAYEPLGLDESGFFSGFVKRLRLYAISHFLSYLILTRSGGWDRDSGLPLGIEDRGA